MPSLYDITQDVWELQELLESGEIDEEVYRDTVEGMDVETKIENICKVIRNLEANAAAYKAEKDRLAAKEKVANNGVARLKESLLAHMLTLNKKKAEAGVFTVTTSESQSVEVIYQDMLDEKYFIPQPEKIDKAAILKDLRAGVEIAGAQITKKPYVRIK